MHLRIDHVQLAMPAGQEGAAREFYSGILDIPEVEKPPALAARGGVWFEDGELRVHLGVEDGFRPARKAHPAFRVVGLKDLEDRSRQAGIEFKPDGNLPGFRRFYVDDPFGNRLEFLEPDHSS